VRAYPATPPWRADIATQCRQRSPVCEPEMGIQTYGFKMLDEEHFMLLSAVHVGLKATYTRGKRSMRAIDSGIRTCLPRLRIVRAA